MEETQINAYKTELAHRKMMLDSIDLPKIPQQGNPAAEWRLRKKRGRAIDSRLSEIGSFARLSCGSLLVGLNVSGNVDVPVRYTNWKDTLRNSLVFQHLDLVQSGQLTGAPYKSYTRLEAAIQSLGTMICLSVRDMEDANLLRSFYELKLYCIKHAFPSEATCDNIIEYIKWLGKYAQATLLKSKWPDPPREPVMVNGQLAPFSGPLKFMSDFYIAGKRNRKFTMAEARACAQVSNLPRSLPYPSKEQVKTSIAQSVKTFTTEKRSDPKQLEKYRHGLMIQREILGPLEHHRTHTSMVSNAVLENSRSQGGRSRILIPSARRFTDQELDFDNISDLIDKVDQFGNRILRSETVELAKIFLRRNICNRNPTMGDLLYLKVEDLPIVWKKSLLERNVPRELGHILNLTASQLITEIGSYEPRPKYSLGIMYFEPGENPVFHLQKEIRVRAGISIEAGLKSRLTTSGMAAFAHLSQLPANLLREHLSVDPFMKVGFQESEKLWEVLKQYRKIC